MLRAEAMSNTLNSPSRAILRIATRGSPLALVQARLARTALAAAHKWGGALDELCPIVPMRTSGDRIHDRMLADAGGKGLFTKEIEEALIAGVADIAVHSMKDVPSVLPKGLEIVAVLPRADPRDVVVVRGGGTFAELPPNARIGTSSVRRQAQVLRARPQAKIVLSRGNIGTRLSKLAAGESDAIILAKAGLDRLPSLSMPKPDVLEGPDWLPALCQGAIAVEIATLNSRAREIVAAINHAPTAIAMACERAFLAALDGSCRTPLAGLARTVGNRVEFEGEVLTPDGRNSWRVAGDVSAVAKDAGALGREAAAELRAAAGAEWPVL